MKAAILKNHSKNKLNLEIEDVAKPIPRSGEVLVKILAAGVNPLDNMIIKKQVNLIVPYKLPLVMGNELVGVVEQIGENVDGFNLGDRVFARLPLNGIGAFADYAAVDSSAIARVPEYLTNEEAAAVPLTALTVMQALDLMNIESGKTIFISGGTGGVGAMAIPIAKAKGLKVITNGSGDSRERVIALGADEFIDYKTEDYAKVLSNIDYVLDTLGGKETMRQLEILNVGGHLVSLRALPNGRFAKRMNMSFLRRMLFSVAGMKFDIASRRRGVSYDFMFVQSNGAQLQEAADILDQLKIKPSIDEVFEFKDINSALDKVANGRSRGKTVLRIG